MSSCFLMGQPTQVTGGRPSKASGSSDNTVLGPWHSIMEVVVAPRDTFPGAEPRRPVLGGSGSIRSPWRAASSHETMTKLFN